MCGDGHEIRLELVECAQLLICAREFEVTPDQEPAALFLLLREELNLLKLLLPLDVSLPLLHVKRRLKEPWRDDEERERNERCDKRKRCPRETRLHHEKRRT